MNDLCADVGHVSLNHKGELLCGDHVDIAEQNENSAVIVLADGLGSGVKASILSTLTSKIISTMMFQGLSLEDCVATIAATLPICSVRNIAYSTFTIILLSDNEYAEIIQYDNPHVILFRDEKNFDYPKTEMSVGGKQIFKSRVKLQENDVFIAMSDGCVYAGTGQAYNFGWQRDNIINYMQNFINEDFTAKTLSTILTDECNRLYGGQPRDDVTVCTVRIRRRKPMNILFGPPSNRDDCVKMMSLFFAKEGKHIVCGGTTASIAANYLGKQVVATMDYLSPDVPPTAKIDGVDLVTEGVLTINKVLEYARDHLADNKHYDHWGSRRDAASLICRLLFEEATDINFYVGRAINPAHQNPDLPINFSIKMNLVEELSSCLKLMGKRIKVSYF